MYTCSIYQLVGEIGHGDGSWVEIDIDWSGVAQTAKTIPGNYPTPEWANFPIWANSTIQITDVVDVIGLPAIDIQIPSLPFHFWPDCVFNSDWTDLAYTIVETASSAAQSLAQVGAPSKPAVTVPSTDSVSVPTSDDISATTASAATAASAASVPSGASLSTASAPDVDVSAAGSISKTDTQVSATTVKTTAVASAPTVQTT